MKPVSVLFVCLGNICRSPMAESVFSKLVAEKHLEQHYNIDSAGLINAHEGESADRRMRLFAGMRGYTITHRSRPVRRSDLDEFDYILCMDSQNWQGLMSMAQTKEHRDKIHYMTDFSHHDQGQDVPDPYYGGDEGFDRVIDMLEDACSGLLDATKPF